MPDVSYSRLSFAEQIAFFRRKLNINTQSWLDIWQEAHDHAFMVAGANRDALVEDFRQAVDKAIADGDTLRDFRKNFDRIVAKHGWDYNGGRNWRSRVIYETNLRTSYAAGRYAQLQAVKDDMPYWEYVHSDAVAHPRELHLQWNGMVLDADDPWWQAHYPPNGWGCQCTVHALSQRDLERLGKSAPDQAPSIDEQKVQIGQRSPGGPREVDVPAGIDPGFGYAPGQRAHEVPSPGSLNQPPGTSPLSRLVSTGAWKPFDIQDARFTGLPAPQARAIHAAELDIYADQAAETAVAVDRAGNEIVRAVGARDRVDLRAYIARLQGLVLTHNHPGGGTFSSADVMTAVYAGLAEVRSVSPRGIYRLAPKERRGWHPELLDIGWPRSRIYQDVREQVLAYRRQLHRSHPDLPADVVNRLCQDRWMLLWARRYGLDYRYIKP